VSSALRSTGLVSAFILLLAAAAPASAQSPVPEKGTWSVSFALPEGGGSNFGIANLVGEQWQLGLEMNFQSSDTDLGPVGDNNAAENEIDDKNFLIGPVIKYYIGESGPVAPYLRASFGAGWNNNEVRQTNAVRVTKTTDYSSRLAVGAEWFPVDGISIGGHTGVLLRYTRAESTINDNGVEQITWSTNTFRSGLNLRIWF